MAINIQYRRDQLKTLTDEVGVYVLCDLDEVPVYVGKSSDGIRSRVRRHLTSARSDIIGNRQVDVWEIAYVWAYPEPDPGKRTELEAQLFHRFNDESALMNGTIPKRPETLLPPPNYSQRVQVMADSEIAEKREPSLRLPRQASRYHELVDHFVSVKNSVQNARAMEGHFQRLAKYHKQLVASAVSKKKAEG